jgi:RNA polymerase sigma factor (sigma-70 family)
VQRGKGEHGLVYYYRHDHMPPPCFRQEADVDPRPSPVAPLTSTDETPPATDGGPASGTVVGTERGGDDVGSGEEPAMPSGDEYVTGLVSAAANGDKSAWNALVERYGSMVWAIARQYRLDTADAADVSQTTWLRLVEHLHRIEQPERVGGWLATTARRESLRVLRLSGRQVPSSADLDRVPDTPSSSALDHDLISGEQGRHVRDLVDQLPERSRMLLHLLSAESPLSYKRISEALSMPIGSIGPTRARALEKLRKLAVDAGFNPEDAFLTG